MMFDPTNDMRDVADGLETVTLLRRGGTPGDAGTVIAHALRRASVTSEAVAFNSSDVRKQMAADGHCSSVDLAWHLPIAELPLAPCLGDVILDGAGQRWTILDVKQAAKSTRWRCNTRNLVVAHRLDDTITVLRAAFTKSSCGAAEPVWQTWRAGIRARVQPGKIEVTNAAQARTAVRQYRVFVAEDLPLDQSHRILGPDGAAYRVISSLGAERIGELQIIEVEAVS